MKATARDCTVPEDALKYLTRESPDGEGELLTAHDAEATDHTALQILEVVQAQIDEFYAGIRRGTQE